MKTRFLKLALLAVLCVGTAVANAQVSGYAEVRKANIVKEPIANFDIAVKTVGSGKVIVILDGIEISQEKFKSLNPSNIEKMELQKGETMKVLYGEKAADGVLFITSKRENSQEVKVTGFTSVSRGKVATEKNVLVSDRGSVANTQTKLSEEVINLVKGLKTVDTKGLSSDEAQTVMKVLNQIKRENSPRVEMPEIICRGSQTQYPRVELAGMKVDAISIAEKPLFILDGKEISIEEFNGLNPNCVEGLKLIKGEEAVNKYGEKAANGVLFITSVKANQEKVQVTGFTTVRKGKGDVTTEPIANIDLAVKAVNQGKVLVILDGIEISEEKLKSLDPNSIEKLELRKGETMKRLYGEKAANGVLFITSVKANQEKVQVTGFTTVRKGKGDVTTEPIANVDLAVKAVNQGNVLVILDGIEISQEKFKGLNPDDVEKIELRKGETMKRLYGEKAAGGVLAITSKKDCKQQKIDNEDVEIIYHGKVISKEEAEKMGISVNVIVEEMKDNQVKIVDAKRQRIAEMRQRQANAPNVHVVTKADLKPVNREAMAKVISCVEPMLHVRGSMAKIESVNSDELPRVTKFKQNGNQVSFRIEVPKSADRAKQKVDIEYELPAEK